MEIQDKEAVERIIKALGFVDIYEMAKAADKKMSDAEYRTFCQQAEYTLPIMRVEFSRMMLDILWESFGKTSSVNDLVFWRGSIHAVEKILERWEKLAIESKQFNTPETPLTFEEKHSPLPLTSDPTT